MTDQSAVRCTADMHNAATLLNLVQLSVAVASISTGLIVKLSRAPSGPLVLHGRKLSQVSVSTVAELTAAVGDSAVEKILVAAGTYYFTSDMCSGSAVCIDRALTIEAQVPGSVVLDAKGGRRVFNIQSGGTAELIGLNITGGSTSVVQSVCLLNLLQHFLHRPDGTLCAPLFGLQGGGVFVDYNGVANFDSCNIHDNAASDVCLPSALALNFHPSPRWNVTRSTFWLAGRWRLCLLQRGGKL